VATELSEFGNPIGFAVGAKNIPFAKPLRQLNQEIFRIDLNQADKQALIEIPGIGEKLAARILEHRAQNGGFSGKEELRQVKGISASLYEKIKDYFK